MNTGTKIKRGECGSKTKCENKERTKQPGLALRQTRLQSVLILNHNAWPNVKQDEEERWLNPT